MNILFLGHSCLATGAERVLLDILNDVPTENNQVFLVLPTSAPDNFSCLIRSEKKIKIKKVSYKNVSSNNLKSLICLLYNVWGLIILFHHIKKHKVDLLYVNTSVNLLGVLLINFVKIRTVWHVHEQPNINIKVISGNLKWIYRKAFKRHNKFNLLFTSAMAQQNWERELNMTIEKYLIANPPVRNLPVYSKRDNKNVTVFGYLGTLHQSKNLILLIESFSVLKHETDSLIALLICGNGPLLASLKEKAIQLDIFEYVKFQQYTDDIMSFYSQIDILVQPSFNESWGMVIIEAISLKIPTIITSESGVAQLLVQDTEALIIDPNSKKELCQKMGMILNPNIRNSISSNAFKKIEKLNLSSSFYTTISHAIFSKKS